MLTEITKRPNSIHSYARWQHHNIVCYVFPANLKMKIESTFIGYLHLDKTYCLLSGRCTRLVYEYFKTIDIHNEDALNDVQLYSLLSVLTDLSKKEIYLVFDLFDMDSSGFIDFNEFYLLVCIFIANKDNQMKAFIHRHAGTVFDLLDKDCVGAVPVLEFKKHGFLFGLQPMAISEIFHEYDISADKVLDYKEFRMFALACIDKQEEINNNKVSLRFDISLND